MNVLAPGDRVLTFAHGYFAGGFAQSAVNLSMDVDEVPVDWRRPIPADVVEDALRRGGHKAVRCVVRWWIVLTRKMHLAQHRSELRR